jgi:hypothetical protein
MGGKVIENPTHYQTRSPSSSDNFIVPPSRTLFMSLSLQKAAELNKGVKNQLH